MKDSHARRPRRKDRRAEKPTSGDRPPRAESRVFCPSAGKPKLRYSTKAAADLSLLYAEGKDFGKGVPHRSYPCSTCCCWHTSSVERLSPPVATDARHYHDSACWGDEASPCWESAKRVVRSMLSRSVPHDVICAKLELTEEQLNRLLP